jgi:hypothetical protein
MKKYLFILIASSFLLNAKAQTKLDDFGRICLQAYLPDQLTLPTEAKNSLLTKLNQIITNNGLASGNSNTRFILTANINMGAKDIIAGPPQMIAQNMDITLFIGDAVTNTVFSNVTISVKGVGINENKAFIEAFKTINVKNRDFISFLEEGKNKIINYYATNCDFILKDAQTLVKQQQYDQVIYNLSLVPDVCKDCYFKCLDTLSVVYQTKIDAEGRVKLNEAKMYWAANQSSQGAEKVGDILSSINPMASCQKEISSFVKALDAKLKADEKARWLFKMKQYEDKIAMQKENMRIAEAKGIRDDAYRENQSVRNAELDKIRIGAVREIAVEYARNQPKTITYNNIYWR